MRKLIYFFTILLACCSVKDEGEIPPNILWITIEDLSPMLGVYGDSNANSPNLDAFAKKSIKYTNAFATAPVCSASRSCIITGYYASSLGTQHLRSEVNIPEAIRPYPKYLREAGYYTTNNSKEDYNFIDSTIWDHSSKKAHWRERKEGQPFFSIFNLVLTHQSSIFGNDSVYYHRIKPFLPHITPTSPENLVLPPYYPDTPEIRKLWARYYTNVSIVDYQFGEILRELEEDGLSDNTIVFFYSDHGTGVPRHKRALHDSGMKIPFMVHVPEKYAAKYNFKPGTEEDNMISFIDLVPTLLELTGLPVPEGYPGNPIISSEPLKEIPYIYGASDRVDEGFELARSIRTKEFLYIRNYLPHLPLLQPNYYTDNSEIMQELNRIRKVSKIDEDPVTGISEIIKVSGKDIEKPLTGPQQKLFAPRRAVEELYDVENDPHQIRNLIADSNYQKVVEGFRKTLRYKIIKNADTGFAPEPELIRLSVNSTPFEFARESGQYPLSQILEVCDLMLLPNAEPADLIQYLEHPEGLVRYWAVITAREVGTETPEVRERLGQLLKDEFPTVQIEAAKLLVEMGDTQSGEVLARHMLAKDPSQVLFASRAFQEVAGYLESKPINALRAFDNIKREVKSGNKNFYLLYSYWALTYVFEEEG